MKTETDWDKDILRITLEIQKKYPELVKYLNEIPVKLTEKDSEEINIKNLKEYYNSLVSVVDKYSKTHEATKTVKNSKMETASLYPLYLPSEDIYNQGEKEMELNPEDLSKNKVPNEMKGTLNEKNFEEDMSGDDLDIPGSELDNQQENIGSEDEENNYYSLGGDNHNDLDEDKG